MAQSLATATAQHRLVGEAIPLWLAVGFALLGLAAGIVAAWLVIPENLHLTVRVSGTEPSAESAGSRHVPSSTLANAGQSPGGAASGEVAGPGASAERQDAAEVASADGAGHELSAVELQARRPSEDQVENRYETREGVREGGREAVPASRPETASLEPQQEARVSEPAPLGSIYAGDCPPLFTVAFDHAKDRPQELDLKDKAGALRAWLRDHPAATILVEGHADAQGEEEYNLLLSFRRAQTVADLLTGTGVPEKQVSTRAYGETLPLAGVSSTSRENRRVTMRLEGTEVCSGILTEKGTR